MTGNHLRLLQANKGKGEFRAEGDELWMYDVIASDDDEAMFWGGISPRAFIDALKATTGPVTLRINSPGGSVFGAQAMVAAMRSHGQPITARIDSLAASAASVIAAECASVQMVDGAWMMIHKAWGVTVGNEEDMRETADLLARMDEQIAATYARRAGSEDTDWMDLMRAETWLTASEAQAIGLADEVVAGSKQRPQARWDLSAFAKAPKAPEPNLFDGDQVRSLIGAINADIEKNKPAPRDERLVREQQLAARLRATTI
jgi:ATP-dependent Clp protease protease subunit